MKNVLLDVNYVYKKQNPSTYIKSLNQKNINKLRNERKNLIQYGLNLPIEIFKNKSILDLGSGTGLYTLIYNLWGSNCTLVEYDKLSHEYSKNLFQKFKRKGSKNIFINSDIFKFKSKKKFDIVNCNGVLHHTSLKKDGIKLMISFLKKKGIILLGASVISGFFQRNLQRLMIYSISKNEAEIYKNSKKFFKKHLSRASKVSGRSVDEIISDTYLNPKIDSYDLKYIIRIFKKNKISMFSIYPRLNSVNDLEMEWKKKNMTKYSNESINFTNLKWFTRSTGNFSDKKTKLYYKNLNMLYSNLNDLSFKNKNKNFNSLNKTQQYVAKLKKNKKINFDYFSYKINNFHNELEMLLILIKTKNLKQLKKFIKNSKYIFKGYSGLGMNYFVGIKE